MGFLWWGKKEPKKPEGVSPSATATLLYGRFVEHLQSALSNWNEKLKPDDRLNPEKLEALSEELGQYFETWFMHGFLPIDKER